MRLRGFTLIEVLTVMAIIGILASIGAYTYAASLTRSRDSQRITDLQFIRNGLEQFYLDNREYPLFDSRDGRNLPQASWQLEANYGCQSPGVWKYLAPKYLDNIPQDPSAKFSINSGDCAPSAFGQYLYYGLPKDSSKTGFYLMARMERTQNINYIGPISQLVDEYERDGFLRLFCIAQDFSTNPTLCSQNAFVTNSKNN
ncbi:MAG: type II secretion system protein [Patescibacteria group bacterium]